MDPAWMDSNCGLMPALGDEMLMDPDTQKILDSMKARDAARGIMHHSFVTGDHGWSLHQQFEAPRQCWEIAIQNAKQGHLLLFSLTCDQLRELVTALKTGQTFDYDDQWIHLRTRIEPQNARQSRVLRGGLLVGVPRKLIDSIQPPPDDAGQMTVPEPARLAS